MEISVSLGDFDFDLELDITTYPSYRPATRNHPEEGEDAEYDIESVDHGFKGITNRDWRLLGDEDRIYCNDVVMKANELKRNIYSDSDNKIILEAINEELKLEAKYSMEH